MLVIPPLHSVTSPTVGVGYLKAALCLAGVPCRARDLNIELFSHLRTSGLSSEWLHWLFPFGERTYGGELLMSQVCFGRSTEDVLEAAAQVRTRSFRLFLSSLGLERRLRSPEAGAVRRGVADFLRREAVGLAAQAGDWVGLSVVVTNIPATIFLARELRRLRPGLRIVLGGPNFHRDNAPAWLAALPEVDAVLVGDARLALGEWVRGGRQSSPGLLVARGDGTGPVRHQPARTKWPPEVPADWGDFDLAAYEPSLIAPVGPDNLKGLVIPVHGATGCSYNKCAFCYEVLLTPRFSARPVEAVVDEVALQQQRHGTNLFFFTDLDFNSDYRRTVELCAQLRRRVPGARFACWLRAHELDADMLEALYAGGCRQYFVGLEAVTDRLLELMVKGYDGAHARRVARALAGFGQRHPDAVYAFNLITHYPGETLADVRETLEVVAAERGLFDRHVAALFEFTLTANTITWRRRCQLGIDEVEGFGKVLLPQELRDIIPSHRYWYDDRAPDYATRCLLWDVFRHSLGHSPRYLRLS
jgi:Radical SAM superfamily